MTEQDDAENMWFLRGHDALFEQAGFSRPLREKAVRALAALYTPAALEQIRPGSEQEFFAPIFGVGWPLLVIAFLEVGLDLCEVGFPVASRLSKRLLVPDQFRDAAFELRVWASLHRFGYTVTEDAGLPGEATWVRRRLGSEDDQRVGSRRPRRRDQQERS